MSEPKRQSENADEQRWQSVLARDAGRDGEFYFGVATTRIYCRPSCRARRPRRENVTFFETTHQAEAAGFRACRRCRPGSPHSERTELVKAACRYIEECMAEDGAVTLQRLAAAVGRSSFHLHRLFKAELGITPRQYADSCRMKRFRGELQNGRSVTAAMHEAGYSSTSRLYERTASQLGMRPDAYRRGAIGTVVRYTVTDSPLGRMLVAATDKGICAVRFGDEDEELEVGLRREYPFATRRRDDAALREQVETLLEQVRGRQPAMRLPVDMRATAFQRLVWEHLKTIPLGVTESYQAVARSIGRPAAVRAVARACAANPVAIAIPCHRVVRADGMYGGYRWGAERKETLLRAERDNAKPRRPAERAARQRRQAATV